MDEGGGERMAVAADDDDDDDDNDGGVVSDDDDDDDDAAVERARLRAADEAAKLADAGGDARASVSLGGASILGGGGSIGGTMRAGGADASSEVDMRGRQRGNAGGWCSGPIRSQEFRPWSPVGAAEKIRAAGCRAGFDLMSVIERKKDEQESFPLHPPSSNQTKINFRSHAPQRCCLERP